MKSMFSTPVTKFTHFNFTLNFFYILPRIVINPLTAGTLKFDYILGKL